MNPSKGDPTVLTLMATIDFQRKQKEALSKELKDQTDYGKYLLDCCHSGIRDPLTLNEFVSIPSQA